MYVLIYSSIYFFIFEKTARKVMYVSLIHSSSMTFKCSIPSKKHTKHTFILLNAVHKNWHVCTGSLIDNYVSHLFKDAANSLMCVLCICNNVSATFS